MKRAAIHLVLATLLLVARVAVGAVTTGDRNAGYFFLPTPPLGFTLMAVPRDSPPGTIRRVLNLPAAPDLIASDTRRIMMLFAPGGPKTGAPRSWLARQIRTDSVTALPSTEPLAPLTTTGEPIDLAVVDAVVYVLIRVNRTHELLQLKGDSWSPISPPVGFDLARPAQLFTLRDHLALFQNVDDQSATLWQLPPLPRSSGGSPPGWTARPVSAIEGAELHVIDDQIVAIDRAPTGDASILLVRPSGNDTIASIPNPGNDYWIVPAGSSITIIESDGALLPRLSCRVLSATGTTLYQGPVRSAAAINQNDLAFLALALASLFAAVLVFVFRPESSRRETILLPKGTALVGPATRALAGIFDAGAAWLIAGFAYGVYFGDLASALLPTGELAPATLLIALPVAILNSTLLEFAIGRSIGKSLTGCRVVSSNGSPITPAQALARNLVRFLCPPLGMAWMLQIPERTHGLFGTIVIIDLPEAPPDG